MKVFLVVPLYFLTECSWLANFLPKEVFSISIFNLMNAK